MHIIKGHLISIFWLSFHRNKQELRKRKLPGHMPSFGH
jgi:hypothetical protein